MASCAQKHALGNAHIMADFDRLKVQHPRIFSNPTVVPNSQLPRPQHSDSMSNQHIFSDLGSEEPK
jgi:hypothetical protein